jgi:hypothetical protein
MTKTTADFLVIAAGIVGLTVVRPQFRQLRSSNLNC